MEGEGTDTVQTNLIRFDLADNFENLLGVDAPEGQVLFGNTSDNWIKSDAMRALLFGGVGNDDLEASGGNANLVGDEGNDTLVATGAGAQLLGGAGNDRLEASGSNAELHGDEGNDTLIAAGANAQLFGGMGDDLFILSSKDTLVVEEQGGGRDTVQTSQFSINLKNYAFVGNATLTGLANLNLTGNSWNNVLTGNAGKNIMTGGWGADTFAFASAADSAVAFHQRDWIMDFNRRLDKIDLSAMDASSKLDGDQAFSFIGNKAFTKSAGQLRFDKVDYRGWSHDYTVISGDINGDGQADFKINLRDDMRLSMDDFIL
jgi:Ca2+-binding RTX toxin-like protein